MPELIITLSILATLILLFFLTLLICFNLTFYSRNKKSKSEEITIPRGKEFEKYRKEIVDWIVKARALNPATFQITSYDGLKLFARYFEYEKGAPIEILFHGYRGEGERDLSAGVERCFACKRSVLLVDQRACGQSEGHVITFGVRERRDCLSWINFVIEHFGSDTKIIISGVSMGAATVLMALGEELPSNVIGVLADCGYSSAKEIIKKVLKQIKLPVAIFYPLIRLSAKLFGRFDLEEAPPIEAVKKTKLPIIFLHGDSDDFVPCEMSRKMHEACVSRKKLCVIEGAGHGLAYLIGPEKYLNDVNEFFSLEEKDKS